PPPPAGAARPGRLATSQVGRYLPRRRGTVPGATAAPARDLCPRRYSERMARPLTASSRHPSIGDLIRHQGPTFSFEFFPPTDPGGGAVVGRSIRALERLRPSFVSVTYGAGGSTRDRTVEVTERLATDTTLLPMAHLTAVNHSVAELRHMIGRFAAIGIRNLMLIRGDPPERKSVV